MKHLGKLMPVLLLVGAVMTCTLASASQLTAEQEVQPSVIAVGGNAMVTVMLSYSGDEALQVIVTPGYTPGIMATSGAQTAELYPGSQQIIQYPIVADRSGSYWITSLISYMDEGISRQLGKESPLTVTGEQGGQQEPPVNVTPPIAPGPIGSNPGGDGSTMPDQPPLDQPPLDLPPGDQPSGDQNPGYQPPGNPPNWSSQYSAE
jgi:hypothetical protein